MNKEEERQDASLMSLSELDHHSGRGQQMKKSVILAAAIAAMTTVAYAQDTSPPNCPPGYQCILTDPAAAAAAKSDRANCPPGYNPDDRGHCLLSDLEAVTRSQQAHEQAEQGEQPKKEPDPNGAVAGPNDVSIEDPNHPDPCWSLRSQYMNTRTNDSWWRFQNCLTLHNFNN
jgi:hypothetical protein